MKMKLLLLIACAAFLVGLNFALTDDETATTEQGLTTVNPNMRFLLRWRYLLREYEANVPKAAEGYPKAYANHLVKYAKSKIAYYYRLVYGKPLSEGH